MQMFRCTKIYYLKLFAARINRSKVNYKNIHADIKSLPSAQTFISCGEYVTAKLSPNMTSQCSWTFQALLLDLKHGYDFYKW